MAERIPNSRPTYQTKTNRTEGTPSPKQKRDFTKKHVEPIDDISEDESSAESDTSDEDEQDGSRISNINKSQIDTPSFDGSNLNILQEQSFSKHQNESKHDPEQSESKHTFKICLFVLVGLIGIFLERCIASGNGSFHYCSMENIKKEFPSQSEYIWNSFKSGVFEVQNFSKPSVFIYLYKDKPEKFVDKFVKKIASYATCVLKKNNNLQPIELHSEELTSNEALNDFGYIIDKYKIELENKAVMIVKHLDKVPGSVAQAFHSFCDEISPLVDNSLFIFTMKVDLYYQSISDYMLVENVLRAKWNELDQDIFEPLFTRISSMIIRLD